MKMRMGFVSNSSSTSFVILSTYLTPGQRTALENYADFVRNTLQWVDIQNQDWEISMLNHRKKKYLFGYVTGNPSDIFRFAAEINIPLDVIYYRANLPHYRPPEDVLKEDETFLEKPLLLQPRKNLPFQFGTKKTQPFRPTSPITQLFKTSDKNFIATWNALKIQDESEMLYWDFIKFLQERLSRDDFCLVLFLIFHFHIKSKKWEPVLEFVKQQMKSICPEIYQLITTKYPKDVVYFFQGVQLALDLYFESDKSIWREYQKIFQDLNTQFHFLEIG